MSTTLTPEIPAAAERRLSSTTAGNAAALAESRAESRLPLLFACLGAAALLLVAAWPMLRWWAWEYTRPESHYAHGPVVPLLAALMVWHRRDAIRAAPKYPAPAALLVLLPALLGLVLAVHADMQALQSTSFLLAICAGVWFVGGRALLRALAAPLAFLWLMAPLPGPLLNDATLGMQRFSTSGATHLLALLGFSPVQSGNVVTMDSYTMTVDVPCSGFSLMLRLLTFSAAFALLTDATRSRRLLLFLFSLPLSLAINTTRIAMIGVVGECLGMSAATAFHDYAGILSLVLCMAALFGFAKVLRCQTFAGQPIF